MNKPAEQIQSVVDVEDVSFSYNGNEDALKNITLSIPRGDYIGLVGPNGAGKTTLLKVMLRLLTPKFGEVRLFGQDVSHFRDWHKVGYVPQKATNFDANFPATVQEVVMMGRYGTRRLFRRPTKEDRRMVREMLEEVGMLDYKDRLIGDLSGGQEQRVFIARALVNRPEVIFLDEPTTGVDRQSQDSIYALLKKLNKELGLTLVLVSHDIERIMREVSQIACINRSLTCHSSPEEYIAESESSSISGKDFKIITHHDHDH